MASSNTGNRTPENTHNDIIGEAGSITDNNTGDLSIGGNITDNDITSNKQTDTPPTNPNNTGENITNIGDAPNDTTVGDFDDGRVNILDSSVVNTSLVDMVDQHDQALEALKRDINSIDSKTVSSGFDDIKSMLRLMDEKVDSLRSDFNTHSSTIDGKFLTMESKLDEKVSAHTSTVDSKLLSLESRVDASMAETASTLTATNTSLMEESKRLASQ